MTTLLLARHGETDWNREFRIQGSSDVELNELGREQAVAHQALRTVEVGERQVQHARTLRERLGYMFKGPGWKPDEAEPAYAAAAATSSASNSAISSPIRSGTSI